MAGEYLSMLALTLSNPPTILSFTAIWWVLLAVVVSMVRPDGDDDPRHRRDLSGLELVAPGGFAAAASVASS